MGLDLNKVWNMNCLEYMKTIPDNSVQFIVADPPYLISDKKDTFHLGDGNLSKYKLVQGDWDLVDHEIIYECIPEFKRILKRGGSLILWYDWRKIGDVANALEEQVLKQIRLNQWVKNNPPPIGSSNSYLPNSKEYFLYCAKNTSYKKQWIKAPFNSKYDNGVYTHSIAGKTRTHPTEKPYTLMEEIILKHTNKGDTVYIPFGGSGVDVEVCIKNDLNYLCTELDTNYYNNIVKKIATIVAKRGENEQ